MVISTSKTVAAAFETVANCLRVTGHDKRPVLPQLLLAITASKWLAKGSVSENHKCPVTVRQLATVPNAAATVLLVLITILKRTISPLIRGSTSVPTVAFAIRWHFGRTQKILGQKKLTRASALIVHGVLRHCQPKAPFDVEKHGDRLDSQSRITTVF